MKTAVLALAMLQAQIPYGYEPVKPKPVYKTTKLSLTEVGISCKDGANPKVEAKMEGFVVVSCRH